MEIDRIGGWVCYGWMYFLLSFIYMRPEEGIVGKRTPVDSVDARGGRSDEWKTDGGGVRLEEDL